MNATHAREWKLLREQGELVQLPSKLVVKLRPVSMEKLFASGAIPDALSNIVASIVSTGQVDTSDLMGTAQKMIELKRLLCTACVVEPKLVDEPNYENNEISYFDLSSEDSEFIMSWAQRPQKDLSTFRTEQDAALESAHDSQDLRV